MQNIISLLALTAASQSLAKPDDGTPLAKDFERLNITSAVSIPTVALQPTGIIPTTITSYLDDTSSASDALNTGTAAAQSSTDGQDNQPDDVITPSTSSQAINLHFGVDLFPILETSATALDGYTYHPYGTFTTSDTEPPASTPVTQPQTHAPHTNLPLPGSTASVVPAGTQQPAGGAIATYTVVVQTTDAQGHVQTATDIAIVHPDATQVTAQLSYAVLQPTTLANGQVVAITTVIPLVSPQPHITAAPGIEVAGTFHTLDASSNLVIDGHTASAGGSAITIANTAVSLFLGGRFALVGTSTVTFTAMTVDSGAISSAGSPNLANYAASASSTGSNAAASLVMSSTGRQAAGLASSEVSHPGHTTTGSTHLSATSSAGVGPGAATTTSSAVTSALVFDLWSLLLALVSLALLI